MASFLVEGQLYITHPYHYGDEILLILVYTRARMRLILLVIL